MKKAKEEAEKWARERLADPNTLIVDCETTGILTKDPDTEIVQLAITNTAGRPVLAMLLKPAKPMDEEVQKVHGITNDMVIDKPFFRQVSRVIANTIEGKHLVAYNADFDIKLLVHMFQKYQFQVPDFDASCCMDRYSEWCGEWSEKKKGFKWQRLPNLAFGNAHDALNDCASTLKVMEKMAGLTPPVEADEIDLDF